MCSRQTCRNGLKNDEILDAEILSFSSKNQFLLSFFIVSIGGTPYEPFSSLLPLSNDTKTEAPTFIDNFLRLFSGGDPFFLIFQPQNKHKKLFFR